MGMDMRSSSGILFQSENLGKERRVFRNCTTVTPPVRHHGDKEGRYRSGLYQSGRPGGQTPAAPRTPCPLMPGYGGRRGGSMSSRFEVGQAVSLYTAHDVLYNVDKAKTVWKTIRMIKPRMCEHLLPVMKIPEIMPYTGGISFLRGRSHLGYRWKRKDHCKLFFGQYGDYMSTSEAIYFRLWDERLGPYWWLTRTRTRDSITPSSGGTTNDPAALRVRRAGNFGRQLQRLVRRHWSGFGYGQSEPDYVAHFQSRQQRESDRTQESSPA